MQNFDQYLKMFNEALRLESFEKKPENLYAPISYTLEAGGKRIRPVLLLMACDMFQGDLTEAIGPALGIEIFHNFTLLHDDLMDQAPMRRNRTSVHIKWDANTAILSGDAMFALAYTYILKAPKKQAHSVVDAFNRLALGVCEGQQYDMDFETQEEVDLSTYMEMIRLKTSALIAGALEIGAILGNAYLEDIQHLYLFGEKIGLAFQLQDDILDLYGKQEEFGKKLGSDIRENKKTFLYLKALIKGSDEQCAILRQWFRTPTTAQNEIKKIEEIKSIFDVLEVQEDARLLMEALNTQASIALAKISVSHERKETLCQLASSLLERKY